MYKCHECGEIFETPETWSEERSGDGWAFEEMSGSPCCHSSYEELWRCGCCGEEVVTFTDYYCDVCKKNLQIDLEELAHTRGKTFNEIVDMIIEVYGDV